MLRSTAEFCSPLLRRARSRTALATQSFLSTIVLAGVACILTSGCGGDDGDANVDAGMTIPDAGVSPSCLEAVNHSDLAWIQSEIITPSCAAFNACHLGAAAQAKNLNLEAGNFLTNTSGIASQNDPNVELIVEGDADASYILMVMGREPIPSGVVINNTMPFGNPLLCDQKLEAVARWVDSL